MWTDTGIEASKEASQNAHVENLVAQAMIF
jgi:hypothetical protein